MSDLAVQQDFSPVQYIKDVFGAAEYINLSTILEDGRPHPSNVRVAHGHSLSLYFLTEASSNKSKNIKRNPNVSGSLLIPPPKPGEGVNFYFHGVAQMLSKDGLTASLYRVSEDERVKQITALACGREDYSKNINYLLDEKSDVRLHRIFLTEA